MMHLILLVLILPGFAERAADDGPAPGPVMLNQDLLEGWWNQARAPDEAASASLEEAYGWPARPAPFAAADYEDPDSVFRLILASTGGRARVYPTERYFYYKFDLGVRRVSGNLRFADIEDGVVHIGYFDDFDRSGKIQVKSYRDGEGVRVEYDPERGVADVEFDGVRAAFQLNLASLDIADGLALEPGEEYISGILDESGHSLHLVFHGPEKTFYYIRAAGQPAPERFAECTTPGGLRLRVGVRSRFVFYVDEATSREVLVGVLEESIRKNNYFDGPFDQVPPRLQIRRQVEASYPYVRYGKGIDDHGNFLGIEHQRIAISPYQSYETLDALMSDLDKLYRPFATGIGRWAMLAYEWKRDYHRTLATRVPAGADGAAAIPMIVGDAEYRHNMTVSAGWPANHWSEPSVLWTEHDAELSAAWPPNHAVELSRPGATGQPAPSEPER